MAMSGLALRSAARDVFDNVMVFRGNGLEEDL